MSLGIGFKIGLSCLVMTPQGAAVLSSYLLDGSGDVLTDGSGNRLTNA